MSDLPLHGSEAFGPTGEGIAHAISTNKPGFFGKMFPHLDPCVAGDDALLTLASAMLDSGANPSGDATGLPAGFTYLGQFIDHDITLDTTPLRERADDPNRVRNFRTPALDLDSLYGQGKEVSPHLYALDPKTGKLSDNFLIGKTVVGGQDPSIPAGFENDLPRNAHGRALIGDERNDENLLVAQTHLAFLKFHNRVVKMLKDDGFDEKGIFKEARRIVTWHYQWIVLFDFVERLTSKGFVRRIFNQGRKFYRFAPRPYMPIEFSVAAYRMGHSMVRPIYNHNAVFPSANFDLLFLFTGKSGNISGDVTLDNGPSFASLPSDWIIDWRRFYDFGLTNGPGVNASRKLDPLIADSLHTLPGVSGPDANLAFRNLRRGVDKGLASGQDIAKAMGLPVLSKEDIETGADGAAAKEAGLTEDTPLWYYILKEAQVEKSGEGLGSVGGRIVAEVLLGLIHGDRNSFLWQRTDWKPHLPSAIPGHFTMVDLLTFVEDINPIKKN